MKVLTAKNIRILITQVNELKIQKENIVSLLGGRVAEKLILDDISTGASNDIERATKIAREYIQVNHLG